MNGEINKRGVSQLQHHYYVHRNGIAGGGSELMHFAINYSYGSYLRHGLNQKWRVTWVSVVYETHSLPLV